MSEYIISDGITTLAVNLEDGSWRVVGTDSALGCKCFWFEWETGQLMTSALGHVFLLERPGEDADGSQPIRYEVETPGRALDLGQVGVVQRVFIDINTRGETLVPSLILDGGTVVPLPKVVRTPVRETWECGGGGASGRIIGVRLAGNILKRVDLYGIEMDVSVGQQEHQRGASG